MKKKILISLLLVSFFNYIGCYSYYTLTEEEINAGRPYPDEKIKLILNDRSEFDCVSLFDSNLDKLCYYKVDTAGTYLMGRGKILNISTGVTSNFNGVINGEMIDSSSLLTTKLTEKYYLWTKSNDCTNFKNGYYTEIKPEDGSGYFIWKP